MKAATRLVSKQDYIRISLFMEVDLLPSDKSGSVHVKSLRVTEVLVFASALQVQDSLTSMCATLNFECEPKDVVEVTNRSSSSPDDRKKFLRDVRASLAGET